MDAKKSTWVRAPSPWRRAVAIGALGLGLGLGCPALAEPGAELVAAREARDAGKLGDAIAHAEKALTELGGAHRLASEQAGAATFLYAQLLHQARRYEEARKQYELALERWSAALGPDHPSVAAVHASLAELHEDLAEPLLALPHRKRVVEILTAGLGETHALVGTAVHNLANTQLKSGDYQAAEQQFSLATRIRAKALGEHPDVAESLVGLATVGRLLGHYDAAGKAATLARDLFARAGAGHEEGLARALQVLAGVALDRGELAVAREQVAQALELMVQLAKGPSTALADTTANVAQVLAALGEYAQAEQVYGSALRMHVAVSGEDHPNVAQVRADLGSLLLDRGNVPAAKAVTEPALGVLEKHFGPSHPALSRTLRVLGRAAEYAGDRAAARRYIERVVDIERKISSSSPGYASALTGLAALLDRSDDPAGAEAAYGQARAIYQQLYGERSPHVAAIVASEAALAAYRGDYQKVFDANLSALELTAASVGEDHPDLIGFLLNLALASTRIGKGDQASRYAARAAELRELQLALGMSTGAESDRRAAYATAFTETNTILALHLSARPTDGELAKVSYRTLLQRKGRLLDELAWTRRSVDSEDQETRGLLADLAARRADLAFHLSHELGKPGYVERTTQLQGELLRLERAVGDRAPAQARRFAHVSADDVLQALPAGSALIDYIKYRPFDFQAQSAGARWQKPHYAAYVLAQGTMRSVDLGDAETIDSAVRALRAELKSAEGNPEPRARDLDRLVLDPVRAWLGKARRIYVAPDGLLNLVPFAALRDEAGQWEVESFELTTLGSGRDLLHRPEGQPVRGPRVVVANPDFGARTLGGPSKATAERGFDLVQTLFAPLPGTAEEAKTVAQAISADKVLLGKDATVAALGQLHGPEILHLATHGFFVPRARDLVPVDPGPNALLPAVLQQVDDPMVRSGLALAGANDPDQVPDGLLSGYEAASLDLRGTKLVVLSACQTGLGDVTDGLEVQGLRRAFTIAGAQSLMVSLWSVSDAETKELMGRFYAALSSGAGRSAALRQAQLSFVRSEPLAHPYYWAAFLMDGDERALDGSLAPVSDGPPGAKLSPGPRGCDCGMATPPPKGPAGLLVAGLLAALSRRRARPARQGRACALRALRLLRSH